MGSSKSPHASPEDSARGKWAGKAPGDPLHSPARESVSDTNASKVPEMDAKPHTPFVATLSRLWFLEGPIAPAIR